MFQTAITGILDFTGIGILLSLVVFGILLCHCFLSRIFVLAIGLIGAPVCSGGFPTSQDGYNVKS